MKYSISLHDTDQVKNQLMALAPSVKSSHRTEAMARGLGYSSNAALIVALRQGPLYCSIDDRIFSEFLKERGGGDLPYGLLSEVVVRVKLPEQRAAINAILAREPDLCLNGYRKYDRLKSPQDNAADFQASRGKMLDSHCVEQFVRALEYLGTLEKSKNVSHKRTSYGYKHDAESYHSERGAGDTYVANGIFIAAAVHAGFTVKRDGDSFNAFINIAVPKKPWQRSNLAGRLSAPKKQAVWRNMMVAGINAGIEQGVFGLAVNDNRWEGKDGIYRFEFDGLPAIASVNDAGFGELSIKVAINPTDRAERFITSANAKFVAGDAFASGWLERQDGAWLQTPATPTVSVSNALLERIVAAKPVPQGFSDNGKFIM